MTQLARRDRARRRLIAAGNLSLWPTGATSLLLVLSSWGAGGTDFFFYPTLMKIVCSSFGLTAILYALAARSALLNRVPATAQVTYLTVNEAERQLHQIYAMQRRQHTGRVIDSVAEPELHPVPPAAWPAAQAARQPVEAPAPAFAEPELHPVPPAAWPAAQQATAAARPAYRAQHARLEDSDDELALVAATGVLVNQPVGSDR